MWIAESASDDLKGLTEMQRVGARSWLQCSQAMVGAVQRLAELNLAATRAVLDESKSLAEDLLQARDLSAMVRVGSRASQPAVPRLTSYARHWYGIAGDATAAVAELVDTQMSAVRRLRDELLGRMQDTMPAAVAPTLVVLKEALLWSDRAYEEVVTLAQRLADATEAGVTAAASDAPAGAEG